MTAQPCGPRVGYAFNVVLDPAREKDEVARRLRAARELRGLSQIELGQLLAEDGLGIHDVGRIERGDLTMTRVHRDALLRHLRVPERWLTSENVDEIVGMQVSDVEIARLLGPRLLAAVQAADTAPGQARQDGSEPGHREESAEGPDR